MPPVLDIELVPNETAISKPLFADDATYQQFRESFIESMIPELERLQEARRKSEEEARQRLLR
ncbi:MAG TPA: hypothetical protein PKJ41_17850 [Bryobacteraceae bacterium]|nr:hypothetical protein [Bryobacteraceae bacterium]